MYRAECGQVTARELYDEFCQRFDCRPDFHELSRAGADIFWLNTEIVPLIAQLTAANVRLGVLSNTSDLHWEFISQGRYRILQDYFEVKVLSFEVGAMKPATEIYQAATEIAGVEPHEIFFTDDRPENIEGALEAGWDAVQYSSAPELAGELRKRGLQFNY